MLTLIYFILILGLIVLVHEFGHFFFAKLFKIYVYEFAIGMGPKIFKWKGKSETEYSIRAIPIGGFCSLAGEDVEYDDGQNVPEGSRLNNKPVWQRFLVMVFGAGNNFLLALVLLFILALGWGATTSDATITQFVHYITVTETNTDLFKENDKILKIDDIVIDTEENGDLSYYINQIKNKEVTVLVDRNNEAKEVVIDKDRLLTEVQCNIPLAAAERDGLKIGDKILSIEGHKVKYSDEVSLYLQIYKRGKPVKFTVLRDGKKLDIMVTPDKEEINKVTTYRIGVISSGKIEHGIIASIKYMFSRFEAIFRQMVITLKGLFIGGLSVKQLSGPVGIYNIVGNTAKNGLASVLYLIALLSVNVGFINLLPFPAFDGGRVLFLIIEKIKGSPVKPQVENTIHTIGFVLLMLLMLYVTFNDILRIF